MKLLKSKMGIPIPTLFLVTTRDEIKAVPKGVPYFFGAESMEEYIVTILEYEVLYQKALSTGYPFDFREILKENGFKGVKGGSDPINSSFGLTKGESIDNNPIQENVGAFVDYIKNGSLYVDITVIKSLNIFPVWMGVLEDAIGVNINNFATYDTNIYNKKLEGMYGGIVLKSPNKNLVCIDISGSIPRQVSATTLVLAQNLSETFYADVLITGSKSTLYEYERIQELNIETIYDENGTDNDQIYFKELLTGSERQYDTLIVFGDGDAPGRGWYNEFQSGGESISDEKGKSFNKWKINSMICLNVDESYHRCNHSKVPIPGYGRWFKTKKVTQIEGWVKDLRKS